MAGDVGPMGHFRVVSSRSAITIKARSNVGPITFVTGSLDGALGLLASNGALVLDKDATSRLEIPLGTLTSGNILYDGEIMRRIDARRFPIAAVELTASSPVAGTNRYELSGTVTLHGVTRQIEGTVTAELSDRGTVIVNGNQVIDVRAFEFGVPSTFMLKIFPEVEIEMHLEAEAET